MSHEYNALKKNNIQYSSQKSPAVLFAVRTIPEHRASFRLLQVFQKLWSCVYCSFIHPNCATRHTVFLIWQDLLLVFLSFVLLDNIFNDRFNHWSDVDHGFNPGILWRLSHRC